MDNRLAFGIALVLVVVWQLLDNAVRLDELESRVVSLEKRKAAKL